MKYIDADKLIAEIGRRIESWTIRGKHSPAGQGRDTCDSRVTELSDLLSFVTSLQKEKPECSSSLVDIDAVREDFITEVYRVLDADTTNDRANAIIEAFDSLPTVFQEQPGLPGIEESGVPGKDYIPVEWVDACERYGKWKIVKQEQPKFKVGDTIHKIGENTVFPMTIERIYDGDYVCVTEHQQLFINIKFQNDYELVEQERSEVDLEKEMQEEYYKYAIYESGSISGEGYQLEAQGHYECNLTRKEFKDIARHFYELGLNTKNKK